MPCTDQNKRGHISVTTELHDRLKIRAQNDGTSISKLVESVINRYLKDQTERLSDILYGKEAD